ncbi:uncharacterized protein LOC117562195 isoform X1 [Gymnodraco acuticeps]|uniref:Uncharacterized protein LOC117562195 isoform X1 n=1 Tax=Gymnodraco acuticeps TaxID=8218 RepID=A0A6P8VXM0_GYMAC|nr:uncharacterized protein LOC117562195 isoform X1 [Gymnodraco acuticeps]
MLLQYQQDSERLAREDRARARDQETEMERLRLTTVVRGAELQQERYKLDLIQEGKLSSGVSPATFDIAYNLRLLPKFEEKTVDSFFGLFERLSQRRQWSDSEKTLLLQCVLTGRAQEAFSALSMADSEDYLRVKTAVLKAYELVPEAYRQQFRKLRKSEGQTYVELVRELMMKFNRWVTASEVVHLNDLRELFLLEQLKDILPERVATYLNENKVKNVTDAGVLADEYTLTHKIHSGERFDWGSRDNWSGDPRCKVDPSTCYFCLGKGHQKKECPVLAKTKGFQNVQFPRPVALAASPHKVTRDDAIAAVKLYTTPQPVAAAVSNYGPALQEVKPRPSQLADEIDPGYAPFIREGYVSLQGSEKKFLVKILRDTGAIDSYITEGVLPFSSVTDTGSGVLFKGMGMQLLSAPKHRLVLSCDLRQGEVAMGVRPSLLVPAVAVILGNDLAGGRVWPDVPLSPVVSSKPVRGELADPEKKLTK